MFRSGPAHRVRAYRPSFLILEDRTLLSTYVVDHLADDGAGTGLNGSLRYCLTNAVDGDVITFGVTGTINLTDALPDLAHNINIQGPGPNLLTVAGAGGIGDDDSGYFSVFTVPEGATVNISGLTITNGAAQVGGGLFNAGTLTLSNSTVTGNRAVCPDFFCGDPPLPLAGGGIFNGNDSGTAILTVSNSTVSSNWIPYAGQGGGIANGSRGDSHVGIVAISNTTVSDNHVGGTYTAQGGGIYNNAGATVAISDSTIAGNTAQSGGGIIGPASTTTLRNTIRALNSDDPATGHIDANYNLIGGDPLLGPLQDNGGPTQTMAVLAGSPALNAGDPAQLGMPDQRGVVRTGGVNIGAYQASASAFVLTAPATVTAGVPFDVTVTAVDPFGRVALGYTGIVTFSTSDRDPNVVLPADYTLTASDQGTYTFSGGFTLVTAGDQTLTVNDTADTTLTGNATVTVASGAGPAGLRPLRDSAAGDLFLAAVSERTPTIP